MPEQCSNCQFSWPGFHFQNSSSHDYKENEKKIIWKDQRWEIKRRWKRKSSVTAGKTWLMNCSCGKTSKTRNQTLPSMSDNQPSDNQSSTVSYGQKTFAKPYHYHIKRWQQEIPLVIEEFFCGSDRQSLTNTRLFLIFPSHAVITWKSRHLLII